MSIPKRILPSDYLTCFDLDQSPCNQFPLFIKTSGYDNSRKITFGSKNDFNDFLLFYTVTGSYQYKKLEKVQSIPAHSVVASACNTPLNFLRTANDSSAIFFVIGGSHSRLFYNLIRNNSNIIMSNPFLGTLDHFIELYQLSIESVDSDNPAYRAMHSSLLLHTIYYELYEIAYNIQKIKKITPVQENVVNEGLKYIAEHYKNDLTVDTICEKISFSKYYFCKLFKKQMGITLHQYVNQYRINKAKELLTYSKLSVHAIALRVGFKNSLTFIRAFERSAHMTPSEYRNYY